LIDFGILFGLPGGRPGPGLVPFVKSPFASRLSNKPKDSLAPDDGKMRPLRILSQVANEKGDIIDVASGKIIGTLESALEPASPTDGLGDGDERLEVVE
jgi:hypothetical protein